MRQTQRCDEMKNIQLTLQYDGTKYNGWQRQGNTKNTIQEKVESVLAKMCGHPIEIHASGRTDAGVHALAQIANFKCECRLSIEEMASYLNRYLPEDILVTDVSEVPMRFHSRLNAKSKTYLYRIAIGKPSVFIRKFVYKAEEKPDVEIMRLAAKELLGMHDFYGFSSIGKTKKSTVRTIHSIDIEEKDGILSIKINGNGFLYNMVRIIVGTLYEIGIGKRSIDCIQDVFATKDRQMAGKTMPPEGLCLKEVFYEEHHFF